MNWWKQNNTHLITFNGHNGATGTGQPILSPIDAHTMDGKIDDGSPVTGKVFSPVGGPTGTWNPNCATTDSAATAEYDLTLDSNECRLFYDIGF